MDSYTFAAELPPKSVVDVAVYDLMAQVSKGSVCKLRCDNDRCFAVPILSCA